jgi:hypothetical protein
MAMLMRTERPIEHSPWDNILANVPLMLAVFGVIGGAMTLGIAIAFPIPADTVAAALLAQFP